MRELKDRLMHGMELSKRDDCNQALTFVKFFRTLTIFKIEEPTLRKQFYNKFYQKM